MKSKTLALMFFSLLLTLFSCGGGNSEPAEETPAATPESEATVEDPILTMDLNSVEAIEDWIALITIKINENLFPTSQPKMISRGDMTYETVVMNPEGRVKIVRAASPNWENLDQGFRYLMRDDRVVVLEELVKTDGGYQINWFYYNNGQLLKASSRQGATIEETRNAVAGEYQSPHGDQDFRLKYDEVQSAGQQFLTEALQG